MPCVAPFFCFFAVFFLYLFTGAANTLFADFADIFIARLVRLALFVALFGELHHDKFTIAAVFCIELHNRVRSSR